MTTTNKSKQNSKIQPRQFDPAQLVEQYDRMAQELTRKQREKQTLQNSLFDARKQIAELKLKLNEQKTKAYQYEVASQRLLKREEQLNRELEKLRKVYGTEQLKLKCVEEKKKLIKNSYNFQNVNNKQYEKTLEQYKNKLEDEQGQSDEESQQEQGTNEQNDLSVRNDQYYKKLLFELRQEIEVLNSRQIKLEQLLAEKQKQTNSLRNQLKKDNVSLMLEITSWRDKFEKQNNQHMSRVEELRTENMKIQQQNKELIKKINKENTKEQKKAETEITRLKKEAEERSNGSQFIKSQYEKMQEISQHKIKELEAKLEEMDKGYKRQLKNKDGEIIRLRNQIQVLQEQRSEKKEFRNKDHQINKLRDQIQDLEKQIRQHSPNKENKNRNQPGKIKSKDAKSRQKSKNSKADKQSLKKVHEQIQPEDNSDEQSLDIRTVEDIKYHIKNLQKLIDQTKKK